jgi:putative Holliday junction resolvase
MTEAHDAVPVLHGRLLGLDVGNARIGLAVSDELGLTVTPLRVVKRVPTARALDAIALAAGAEQAAGVVVGLPLHAAGGESEQTRLVLAFVAKLRERLEVPVVTWDERYSTVEAERILRTRGVRRDRWREQIDAIAAQVILQDYLDAQQP